MHEEKAINIGVVFNQEGRVLMIRRMREESGGRGGVLRWAFPGGRAHEGESGAECAKREIYEETGYAITVVKEISSRMHPQFPATITYYLCELAMPEPVCRPSEPYEVAVIRWVRPQDVAELVTSDLDANVQALLQTRSVAGAPDKELIVRHGDRVKIVMQNGAQETLTITSAGNADISKGTISDKSPVGKALIGAHVGDVIAYRVGDNLRTLTLSELL